MAQSPEDISFIGPGSIPQWKRASEILGDKLYDEAITEAHKGDAPAIPNYWDAPEDVSRALAETPPDSDRNIFTTDLTLGHLGPIELPCVRLHLVAYYATEAVEQNTGWNLGINKEFVRLGGIRGSVVPSRAKRGITSILMKSTQNVKVNEIKDVIGTHEPGFDGEEKTSTLMRIKNALGLKED